MLKGAQHGLQECCLRGGGGCGLLLAQRASLCVAHGCAAAGQLQRGLQMCSLLHRRYTFTVLFGRASKVAMLHLDGDACSLL